MAGAPERPNAAGDPAVRAVAAAGVVAAGGALAVGRVLQERAARRSATESRRYRLASGEPPAAGVRRIARGQIDAATEELKSAGDAGAAVHEARKSLKRVRSLVRLARDELGEDAYRRENTTFRDAGRRLSGARDAKVVLETLDGLTAAHAEEVPRDAFAGLREALAAEADAAHARLEDDASAIDSTLDTLAASRLRLAAWPLRDGAGLEILAPGFRRTYRRGRRALRAPRRETTTENLHELRKRAKDTWHASQVARPAAPKRMKKLAKRAHRLSDLVGDDHDLTVLADAADARAAALRPGERELLGAIIDRRRAALQREALALGRRVYRRRPRKVASVLAGATAGA
jgi:CHAD domain-containing protein